MTEDKINSEGPDITSVTTSISQTGKKTMKSSILSKALMVKIYQGGLSVEEIGRGAQDFYCKKGEVVFTDGYAVCMDE